MALVRLTALWQPKEKKKYGLSGQNGDLVYYVFKNDKKDKPTQPDYFLCVGGAKKEGEANGAEEPKEGDLPF